MSWAKPLDIVGTPIEVVKSEGLAENRWPPRQDEDAPLRITAVGFGRRSAVMLMGPTFGSRWHSTDVNKLIISLKMQVMMRQLLGPTEHRLQAVIVAEIPRAGSRSA